MIKVQLNAEYSLEMMYFLHGPYKLQETLVIHVIIINITDFMAIHSYSQILFELIVVMATKD